MTQAFNLSQLANNLNTSGQLDATDGLTGAVPVANGGTGQSSLTANAVILGNGTSGVTTVAPSTSGNILVSNGTTWVSQAPSGGGVTSLNGQTGAITTTNIDSIGTSICAVHAVTSGWAGQYGAAVTVAQNGTVAGSALRYAYNLRGDSGDATPFPSTSTQSIGGYSRGGTALSGTWRCVGRNAGYYTYDPCSPLASYNGSLFVRIS